MPSYNTAVMLLKVNFNTVSPFAKSTNGKFIHLSHKRPRNENVLAKRKKSKAKYFGMHTEQIKVRKTWSGYKLFA